MSNLTSTQKFSVLYHDLFDFPLTEDEISKWSCVNHNKRKSLQIKQTKGYYHIKGRESVVELRQQRQKASEKKLKIAKKAARIIAIIPSIKLVAISGALAMNNASKDSDIDLLIITSANSIWITRPFVYLLLKLNGFNIRKPKDPNERDKLCLNLWMDESNLKIEEQNLYTAHELAQLQPLVSKQSTFEYLLSQNSWVKKYWPNAVKLEEVNRTTYTANVVLRALNYLFFLPQRIYMQSKVTRETVTPTRAFFHPRDWGKEIENRLNL